MLPNRVHIITALLLSVLPWMAEAAVQTQFVAPEKYRDAIPRDSGARASAKDPTLVEIGKHLDTLGKRYLAADETLRIKVLDLDLAGELKPIGNHMELIRLKNTLYWPSMRVSYELEKDGKIQAKGEETISDMSYLEHANHYADGDSLRHEKLMLEDWFARKFGKRS